MKVDTICYHQGLSGPFPSLASNTIMGRCALDGDFKGNYATEYGMEEEVIFEK